MVESRDEQCSRRKSIRFASLKKGGSSFYKNSERKRSKGSIEIERKIDGKKKGEREMGGGFVEYINIISDILRPVMLYLSIEQVFHFSRSNVT